MMLFEIDKAVSGEYHYRLLTEAGGEIVLRSEMYKTKSGCEKGIASVKVNAPLEERYERLYAANGQYYFNLKAVNGEVIGTSRLYPDSGARDKGLGLVKAGATDALVRELA